MRRSAVRSLKEKVGKEVWDVVCEQRVGCMLQGGWFNAARLLVPGMVVMAKANPSKPLRFLRLVSFECFRFCYGSVLFR